MFIIEFFNEWCQLKNVMAANFKGASLTAISAPMELSVGP